MDERLRSRDRVPYMDRLRLGKCPGCGEKATYEGANIIVEGGNACWCPIHTLCDDCWNATVAFREYARWCKAQGAPHQTCQSGHKRIQDPRRKPWKGFKPQ